MFTHSSLSVYIELILFLALLAFKLWSKAHHHMQAKIAWSFVSEMIYDSDGLFYKLQLHSFPLLEAYCSEGLQQFHLEFVVACAGLELQQLAHH